MTDALTCLRCAGVMLGRLPESNDDITFFECPSCYRHYAKKPAGILTYRWLHPVTLALYYVLFEDNPVPRAEWAAAEFMKNRSREDILRMTDEIELELTHPSQPIREALGNRASEEKCRDYLRAFVSHIHEHLG